MASDIQKAAPQIEGCRQLRSMGREEAIEHQRRWEILVEEKGRILQHPTRTQLVLITLRR